MYQITYNGTVIYDPRLASYHVVNDPTLALAVNTAGTLSLSIYKQHPRYADPQRLAGEIEVADGSEILLRGRIIQEERDIYDTRKLVAEGAMAYLNDTVVRPFAFPEDVADDPEYQEASEDGNVVEYFLAWILSMHNEQTDEAHQLHLGTVTVSDPNNYISRSSDQYASAWETLKDKLFESKLGGYLVPRYETDGTYIDYVSSFSLTNTQEVVFAGNLSDIKRNFDATKSYTAVLPLGAKEEDEDGNEKQVTITDLPDGPINADIYKEGDYIYSAAGVELYGTIFAPTGETTWDDVTINQNLLSRAVSFLGQNRSGDQKEITVSAADLHFSDATIAAFRPYRNAMVRSAPHGISDAYEVTAVTYKLQSPMSSMLTLGKAGRTLSGDIGKASRSTDKQIRDVRNAVRENAQIAAGLDTRITEVISSISQTASEIVLAALESYVQTGDLETYKQEVSTQFRLTADQIQLLFSTATQQIADVNGDLQAIYAERLKYIRFVDGDIVLGESGNQITLRIANDRISFLDAGAEVAYISERRLYITDAHFLTSLRIGIFEFVPRENGNLSFRKVATS